jgi:hypothetical protein
MKNGRSKYMYAGFVLFLAPTIAFLSVVTKAAAADESTTPVKSATSSTAKKNSSQTAGKKSKEDLAIDLVWRRADVKSWLKLFPKGTSKLGGHPAATADHSEGDLYSVHIYEDLPDHTATFNWYDVNVKNGKITKKF